MTAMLLHFCCSVVNARWRHSIIRYNAWLDSPIIIETGWHTKGMSSVAFSSDDKFIISGAGDKTVRVWDAESGYCVQTLEGHTNLMSYGAPVSPPRHIYKYYYDPLLSYDQYGNNLTLWELGNRDRTVHVWEAESGKLLTVGGDIEYWAMVWVILNLLMCLLLGILINKLAALRQNHRKLIHVMIISFVLVLVTECMIFSNITKKTTRNYIELHLGYFGSVAIVTLFNSLLVMTSVIISNLFYNDWKSWVLNRYKFFLEMETNADGSIQNEDQFEGECFCNPCRCLCCFLYKPANNHSTCCSRFQWCHKPGSWRDTRNSIRGKKERRTAFSCVIFKWNNLPLFVIANVILTFGPHWFVLPSNMGTFILKVSGMIVNIMFSMRVHLDLHKNKYLQDLLIDIRWDDQRCISHLLCLVVILLLLAWLCCLCYFSKNCLEEHSPTNSTSNNLNQEEGDGNLLEKLGLVYEGGGALWSFGCIAYILTYWLGKKPNDSDDGSSSRSRNSSFSSTGVSGGTNDESRRRYIPPTYIHVSDVDSNIGHSDSQYKNDSPDGSDAEEDNGENSNQRTRRAIGDRIQAKCRGWTRHVPGRITKVNSDGTYCITFDSGEKKASVTEDEIHGNVNDDKDNDGERETKNDKKTQFTIASYANQQNTTRRSNSSTLPSPISSVVDNSLIETEEYYLSQSEQLI